MWFSTQGCLSKALGGGLPSLPSVSLATAGRGFTCFSSSSTSPAFCRRDCLSVSSARSVYSWAHLRTNGLLV